MGYVNLPNIGTTDIHITFSLNKTNLNLDFLLKGYFCSSCSKVGRRIETNFVLTIKSTMGHIELLVSEVFNVSDLI